MELKAAKEAWKNNGSPTKNMEKSTFPVSYVDFLFYFFCTKMFGLELVDVTALPVFFFGWPGRS